MLMHLLRLLVSFSWPSFVKSEEFSFVRLVCCLELSGCFDLIM